MKMLKYQGIMHPGFSLFVPMNSSKFQAHNASVPVSFQFVVTFLSHRVCKNLPNPKETLY